MYIFFTLQPLILLATLLPNSYYRSYIVYCSASHYHQYNHTVMVSFLCVLIPNTAVQWKWDADRMYSLETSGRRKTSYHAQ